MKNNLLELKDVCLTYHNKQGETQALNNINLQVKSGEFVSIVGPSGCGKTTILSIISGILKASSGEVFINEEKVGEKSDLVGYMFQKDHLFEWRTIWQNVILGLEIKKTKTPENLEYVESLLKKYGLYEFRNAKPRELSGGMRQRVALIRTLALKPKLLLLDEPFSALDFQTRLNVCDDVHKIIKEEKQTAILVSHDISEAISISDRVVVLTKRPAQIKKIIYINLKQETPFKRREEIGFSTIFDEIWKELQEDEKEKKWLFKRAYRIFKKR